MEENLIHIGECRCCHQTITLDPPVSTLDDADRAATLMCECKAGQIVRRQMQQQDTIKELFGELDDDLLDLLNRTAECIRNFGVESASIKFDDGPVAKLKINDSVTVLPVHTDARAGLLSAGRQFRAAAADRGGVG